MFEVSILPAALTDIGRNDAVRLAVASESASRLEMPPGDADARPRLVSRSSSSAKAIERSPLPSTIRRPRSAADAVRAHTRLKVTSTLPRVAFEYGQICSASSTKALA